MKAALLVFGILFAVCLAIACTGGEPANVGVTEPIMVSGAQFVSGEMPGTTPVDGGEPLEAGATEPPLSVVQVAYTNQLVIPGASAKSFTGLVTTDAVAVGIRLADMGTGYWVVPVGGPDAMVARADDFAFNASFDIDDPPGIHALRVVAIDGNGNGGMQSDTEVCVEWRIPDNDHSCIPTNAVPAVVFTLQWDANFDVDLHVIDPNGVDINPKTNPLQFPVDAGAPPTGDPKIDRDSLGQCIPDGWRQEDLVFQNYPATGNYDIYANPFDACGQESVRFVLTIYEAGSDGNLHATYTQGGELLANSVNGGAASGLFIAEKQFN